jgi:ribosome-binding protein aMBF1 (putative translation factor)
MGWIEDYMAECTGQHTYIYGDSIYKNKKREGEQSSTKKASSNNELIKDYKRRINEARERGGHKKLYDDV